MNEIVSISPYSERTARVRIYNPEVAVKCLPGHFVIIKFKKEGERIPFSIINSDSDNGIIDVIIHRADGLEEILSMLKPGEALPDLLGPLGRPAQIMENQKILFFGDGSAKAKELIKADNATFVDDVEPLAVDMIALAERHYAQRNFLDTAYAVPNYLKDFQATRPKNKVLGEK